MSRKSTKKQARVKKRKQLKQKQRTLAAQRKLEEDLRFQQRKFDVVGYVAVKKANLLNLYCFGPAAYLVPTPEYFHNIIEEDLRSFTLEKVTAFHLIAAMNKGAPYFMHESVARYLQSMGMPFKEEFLHDAHGDRFAIFNGRTFVSQSNMKAELPQ